MSDEATTSSPDELCAEVRELREKLDRMLCQHIVLDVVITCLVMRGRIASAIADDLGALSSALGTVGATHIDPILRRLLSQLSQLGEGEGDAIIPKLKMTVDHVQENYRRIGELA